MAVVGVSAPWGRRKAAARQQADEGAPGMVAPSSQSAHSKTASTPGSLVAMRIGTTHGIWVCTHSKSEVGCPALSDR